MDIDYLAEMETIICGYEEIQCLLDHYQDNDAEKCYLPVNLLEKMNEQLRDTVANIRSETVVREELVKELFKKVGIVEGNQPKAVA